MAVRAHEYGHLALAGSDVMPKSPEPVLKADPELDVGWVDAVGNAIVNERMLRKGVKEIKGLPPFDSVAKIAEDNGVTPDEVKAEIEPHVWAQDLFGAWAFYDGEGLKNCPAVFSSAYYNALETLQNGQLALLQQIFDQFRESNRKKKVWRPTEIAKIARDLQNIFGPDSEPVKSMPIPQRYDTDGTRGEWGDMTLVKLKLPHRIKSAFRAMKPHAGFVGAFRYPHRADLRISDGRAFGRKRKVKGGTILIDHSGSMHLDYNDVRQIIEDAPAATIAAYAADREAQDSNKGKLVILAQGGKVSDYQQVYDHVGGRNLVDGPALDWLAKMPQPRLWVSDGFVNGRDGSQGANLVAEATAKVRRGRIARIPTVSEAVEYVKRF